MLEHCVRSVCNLGDTRHTSLIDYKPLIISSEFSYSLGNSQLVKSNMVEVVRVIISVQSHECARSSQDFLRPKMQKYITS